MPKSTVSLEMDRGVRRVRRAVRRRAPGTCRAASRCPSARGTPPKRSGHRLAGFHLIGKRPVAVRPSARGSTHPRRCAVHREDGGEEVLLVDRRPAAPGAARSWSRACRFGPCVLAGRPPRGTRRRPRCPRRRRSTASPRASDRWLARVEHRSSPVQGPGGRFFTVTRGELEAVVHPGDLFVTSHALRRAMKATPCRPSSADP